MSDLIKTPQILNSKECLALSSKCISQKIKTRTALVGDNLTIRRALPHRDRKTIGAWCFLDHFGPLNLTNTNGLRVIGNIEIANEIVDIDTLLYLPCGKPSTHIRVQKGSRILIIGGEPFEEDVLIWWNFVARTKEEMIDAANAWNNHTEFGEVKGYQGDRLTPPSLS